MTGPTIWSWMLGTKVSRRKGNLKVRLRNWKISYIFSSAEVEISENDDGNRAENKAANERQKSSGGRMSGA